MSYFADGFDDLGVVEETESEVPGVADFPAGEEFFRIRMEVVVGGKAESSDR